MFSGLPGFHQRSKAAYSSLVDLIHSHFHHRAVQNAVQISVHSPVHGPVHSPEFSFYSDPVHTTVYPYALQVYSPCLHVWGILIEIGCVCTAGGKLDSNPDSDHLWIVTNQDSGPGTRVNVPYECSVKKKCWHAHMRMHT